MSAQLPDLQDQSDRELAEVLDHLSRRFPHLPERWLDELARTVHERFREASVRTFVPLLVERQVVVAVRRTSATLSAADGSVSSPTSSRGHGWEAGHGRDEAPPEPSLESGVLQTGAGQQAQWRGILA